MRYNRNIRIKVIPLLLFNLFASVLLAQDSQFSQYYSAPLHLSPSFAGSTVGGRVVGNYRLQWPFIKSYHTSALSVDYNLPTFSSGIGLMAYNEIAGTPNLMRTTVAGNYAFNIAIKKKFFIRPGLAFSYSRLNIDYKNLTFGDEIFFGLDETRENLPVASKGYVDATASVLGMTKLYWLGVTVSHLLRPNESLTGLQSQIPMKTLVFGGGKIDLNGRLGRDNEKSITYGFLYRSQEKFDQLDLGCYYMKIPMVLGIWYRGLPGIKKNAVNGINHDALVLIFGYKRKNYGVAYSYDVTVSRLFLDSGGAHEVSLQYLFNQDRQEKRHEKRVVVPCPRF